MHTPRTHQLYVGIKIAVGWSEWYFVFGHFPYDVHKLLASFLSAKQREGGGETPLPKTKKMAASASIRIVYKGIGAADTGSQHSSRNLAVRYWLYVAQARCISPQSGGEIPRNEADRLAFPRVKMTSYFCCTAHIKPYTTHLALCPQQYRRSYLPKSWIFLGARSSLPRIMCIASASRTDRKS